MLLGCVAISLAAHAGAFFLFQVTEPPGSTIARAAPQISVLTPSSPEAVALLRWIDAQDPALAATIASAPPTALLETTYRPSYATMRTAPLGPVENMVAVPFPAARDPFEIIARADARPAPPASAGVVQPTTLTFAEPLARRAPSAPPPLVPRQRANEPVEPARFLLGVTARGEVRFTFLQDSSGQPALDEQVAAHLQTLVFAPADAPMTWASASVIWGNDAYGEKPNPP
ncbi:MAG: hypothetical protein K8R23_06030 [Chthoniobacter sp.]|nr:hypothetical protein [Chthoniobacter sp.]